MLLYSNYTNSALHVSGSRTGVLYPIPYGVLLLPLLEHFQETTPSKNTKTVAI